jgi:hypothetical protein
VTAPQPVTPAATATPARRSHLGWLGIAIVALGVAASIAGALYVMHVRPKAGVVIDAIPIGPNAEVVIRAEDGGSRNFLELHVDGKLRWQAYIPHYAGSKGRPAIAWGPDTLTVRIERDGRAEVFAYSLDTAAKIGGFQLAFEHEPIQTQPTGPITLTDHLRSYEFVGGPDWHQLIAVNLGTGTGVWKVDLGPAPVTDGGVKDGTVWVQQGSVRRAFDAVTGSLRSSNNL